MRALILIDLQHDFLPGGALAVKEGDQVIPIANRLQGQFERVIATQDWHPQTHESFAANHSGGQVGEVIDLHGLPQVLWPVHCTQGSTGAALASDLETDHIDAVFRKGIDPEIDSYSGFFDNGRRRETGLATYLREQGITQVYLMGLATDYCVRYSALDAVSLGLETYLITDGCRGVELQAGDIAQALQEMKDAGVQLILSTDIDMHSPQN